MANRPSSRGEEAGVMGIDEPTAFPFGRISLPPTVSLPKNIANQYEQRRMIYTGLTSGTSDGK